MQQPGAGCAQPRAGPVQRGVLVADGYRALPPEWRPAGGVPIIPGTDISGVVSGLGEGVTGLAAGDPVYALVRFPEGVFGGSNGYAEYVSVPAAHLAPGPAGIGHVQAAAAPMSLLTAWQFLVDPGHDEPNPLQPARHEPVPRDGRRVLINGAAEAARQGITVSATQVRSSGAQLRQLAPLLSDGRIRAVIDGTYPLAEARKAHERAERGHIQGKIVLTVD